MRGVRGWLVVLVLAVEVVGAGGLESARGQAPAAELTTRDGAAGKPLSEKQKKLMEDTDRLVKMAAELKVSVEKSNKNELSMDVVRKAEAVEQLARSVKERMRTDR